jgi:hypothetical protein
MVVEVCCRLHDCTFAAHEYIYKIKCVVHPPAAVREVPAWCRFRRLTLVGGCWSPCAKLQTACLARANSKTRVSVELNGGPRRGWARSEVGSDFFIMQKGTVQVMRTEAETKKTHHSGECGARVPILLLAFGVRRPQTRHAATRVLAGACWQACCLRSRLARTSAKTHAWNWRCAVQ